MRRQEIEILREEYIQPKGQERDRRFNSRIGADIASASILVGEIFGDLDETSFGISWWTSLPAQERILISDYLYQCADGIETNLAEAKLHYWELLDAREKENRRIVDLLYRAPDGSVRARMPPSTTAIDDLSNKLEGLHICGFFRAIGSSLDCLGGAIVGVVALSTSLRKGGIGAAQAALKRITHPSNSGEQLQADFRDFFDNAKSAIGPQDWLEWATQYRNMYIHRGRRSTFNQIVPHDAGILDAQGQLIPRVATTLHLAKYPDKSDAEAMILHGVTLREDADITLSRLFDSCRELQGSICERLVSIWRERRSNPTLLQQPVSQWNNESKTCSFDGFEPGTPDPGGDVLMSHPILRHRALAASVDDAHRSLWTNSRWEH